MSTFLDDITCSLHQILEPAGFECHAFKIGWYNDAVSAAFKLPYDYDTLAVLVLSTPHMFEKSFIPFITRQDCTGPRDPIDQCVQEKFSDVIQNYSTEDIDVMFDYELTPTRRPRLLVQTAAHVSGACYYYQMTDIKNQPWGKKKKFGVCIHPRYGGWFAMRGAFIFKNKQCPELQRRPPPDIIPTEEERIELLERFNGNWKDNRFRDIITPEARYSKEQQLYFATLPKNREHLVKSLKIADSELHEHNQQIDDQV